MLNFDVSSTAPVYFSGLTFLLSDDEEGTGCVFAGDPATWRRLHDEE